ncbi:MAG: glycosyltransferase family 2 protein [Thiobacillus sp.]
MKPDSTVAIVILNWNGASDTLACLDSLVALTHPNFNVIVVDNGSRDDSLALLRPYQSPYPMALLETGANLGFAEGNNVGIRAALEAGADAVLLLNNDTVADPDLVSALVDAAKAHPEGGVFSAKIFYHAEPNKLWYAGAKWLADQQHFQHVGIGEIDDGQSYEDIVETDYASGCALFIRSEVINQIGLMDAKFFLTYEESDWCYRTRAAGFKCLFVPGAKLWHKVSASFGGVESPLQLYFYSRNILLWAERHLPRAAYWSLFRKTFHDSLRFSMGTRQDGALFKRLVWAFSSLWTRLRQGGHDATGRARYLGFRDYLLRRFGDCPDEVRHLKVRS